MGGNNGLDALQCCYREQIAYSIYTKFREPKLYRMAAKGEWDLIPERCRTCPKEAEFRHKYPPNDTALHRLLKSSELESTLDLDSETRTEMGKIKLKAIESILVASRSAATISDSFGKTPLHYACMDLGASASIETIRMIAEANPAAAVSQDSEERTPLHILVARNDDRISKELVDLLRGPKGLTLEVQDQLKETPWDVVNRRADEMENGDELLELLKPEK